MMDPARPGENDEALDILRRLEPALTDVRGRLQRIEDRVERVSA